MRVLLLADAFLSHALRRSLEHNGLLTECMQDVCTAEREVLAGRHDLLLCVGEVGRANQLPLVARLRSRGLTLPIMMMSSQATAQQRACAFDAGIDDYVALSIETVELVARCRALVRSRRRLSGHQDGGGRITINLLNRELKIDGRPVALTLREWAIFECLWRNNGRQVSKTQLLHSLPHCAGEVSENAVEVYVSRLRQKLGDVVSISASRGLGYRMAFAQQIDAAALQNR